MTSPNIPAFLEQCRTIIGNDFVFGPEDEGLNELRDQFGPYYDTDREPLPGGAVRPGTADEVRAVVTLANKLGVALWTSSRGRNYGYGGPAPVRRGDIALDLRRLDRIIEIDEHRAFAVIEPGVTTGQLLAEIEARGLRLWPDCTSSPYSSVIGNALERGVGYGPLSERFEALCGLEVVLADGTLLRTGTGGVSGSTTWHENKYGYGPVLDGLFTQSNLGVVTRAGVWLNPEPPAFRHVEFTIDVTGDFDDRLAQFIDTLGQLRRARIIDTGANSGPWMGPGTYRARFGFHGTPAIVEAKWQATLAALADVPTIQHETGYYEAPYDYADWNAHARLAAGLPTGLEEDNWEVAHYGLFGGLVIPNTGEAFVRAYRTLEKIYAAHGRMMPIPGFNLHSTRSLVILVGAELKGNYLFPDNGADIDNQVSVDLVRAVQEEAAKHGWCEYRTGTQFMDEVLAQQDFGGGSRAVVLERIKHALDPNGILSPGKSGIWGSAARP